jgi:Fur family ferric uptake transcriptional regulator
MVNEEKLDKRLEEVMHIFTNHLIQNNLRRTPERYTILEEIYKNDKHFDAEDLYIRMKNNSFNVSRATVYNTLDLLVNCELVLKHQFGQNHAQYEKSYHTRQHDHLICSDCGKVIEFCDPRIQQIKDTIGQIFSHEIHHHALTLYGRCHLANCPESKTKQHC